MGRNKGNWSSEHYRGSWRKGTILFWDPWVFLLKLMSVWKSDEKLIIFASLISPTKIALFEKQYQAFDTAFHHSMKVCLRSLFLGKEVLIPHSLLILPIPSVSYKNLACRTSVNVIQNIVSFPNPRRFDPCLHFGESHILSNPASR